MSGLTYEFCAGAPTWPGCDAVIADHEAAQNAPKDGGMKMDGGDDHMMEEKADPMMGQMAYTLTAVLGAANAGLTLFRYADTVDISALGEVDNIENYRMIVDYSELAFWGVASLTQIATLFGAMGEQNLMVWMYGSMIMGLVGLVVEAYMWYVRDQAKDDSASFAVVESDMVKYAAMHAAMSLNLMMEHKNWMAAQWMLLDDETKEKMMPSDKRDDDMPESLFSLMF